jgi:hypothetical protein
MIWKRFWKRSPINTDPWSTKIRIDPLNKAREEEYPKEMAHLFIDLGIIK